ncbi:L,D-transpeptidase family protein [Hydrogenophaga sp.]|uniref:L,D-transpeptidase family protein n=1 Tax=Hydrogenophaga sp. TaxID=1904254 RepID=UPI0027307DCA|nr:L,D-transpeptidase family protein [Hydrogenophaga sp.]MDP1686258.1 L,D-transpeptidase family protein [Hydrogenophaga sp.]
MSMDWCLPREIAARHTGHFCYRWRLCDAKMKNRWLNMLGACVLPPIVGVGVCGGIIHLLKNHDLFRAAASLPAASASQPRLGRLSETAAEIRAALPMDSTFDMVPPRMPVSEEKTALQRAATSPKRTPTAKSEPAELAVKKAAPKTVRPRVWRPLMDPVTEFWTTLMPRTDALPQAYQAVLNDDPAHLARIIALGLSPHEKTPGGDTPLCAAVRMGRAECVRVLALAGVNLNEPAHEQQPPIVIASLRRNAPVLEALLDSGVDPNTRFKTPVQKSVIERCTIKDLRNALESDRGITPLICCAARGDVEGAIALMQAGAKAGVCTTRYHRYPINFAATQGYLFLMRVLLGRDPESEPDTLVTVHLSSQRAWVMKQGRIINSTSVSTGRAGYNTPAGRYVITDKHRSHTSTLYHVAMPWFMRLNCGAIGLHSGYVTGRPASHGCIRLPYEKAKEFFHQVTVGDEVEIVH